jgi:hypothetical protein
LSLFTPETSVLPSVVPQPQAKSLNWSVTQKSSFGIPRCFQPPRTDERRPKHLPLAAGITYPLTRGLVLVSYLSFRRALTVSNPLFLTPRWCLSSLAGLRTYERTVVLRFRSGCSLLPESFWDDGKPKSETPLCDSVMMRSVDDWPLAKILFQISGGKPRSVTVLRGVTGCPVSSS